MIRRLQLSRARAADVMRSATPCQGFRVPTKVTTTRLGSSGWG